MASKKSNPIKFKIMCRNCKKFYLVYPKHNSLCEKCKANAIKAWSARQEEFSDGH